MRFAVLLLPLTSFITSCNGQINTAKEHTSKVATTAKITRTQGVSSGNVSCELQDREGNIWFSIAGEGVYRYDGKSFTNFTTKDGLCSNHAGPIIQDSKGNILVGTDTGICVYSGKMFYSYPGPAAIRQLSIICIMEDSNGALWFAAMEGGVYCYDGKTLKSYLRNNDYPFNLGEDHQLIIDIGQDKNGNIWFCSWNGGGIWKYDGLTFTNFLPPEQYYKTNEDGRSMANDAQNNSNTAFLPGNAYQPSVTHISDDMIHATAVDKQGNIWFATRRHGACRYDGTSFISFRETEGFVSYGITSIMQDNKGNLWFGTDKNGVFAYNGNAFKNYTSKNGLINNSVRSILEDKNGNLWFGTRWFGLSRFDGKTFTTFSGEEFAQ